MTPLQPARLAFAPDGTPISTIYDEIYHSTQGGLAQSRHVFLGGNDLPQRWQGRDRFVILETGFGLGLNFLATWQAWRADPQRCRRLHFVSVEKHPFSAADLTTAQHAWPELGEFAEELQRHWPPLTPGMHRLYLDGGRVILTLIFGDAETQLRAVNASVDAFFLDGFSPARNPGIWTPYLCKALARLAAPGATLATWCIARVARDALSDAEFDLSRRPGFAERREMLVGHFRSRRPDRHHAPTDRRAIVIGAGIAGCTTAYRLAAAGWQVTVLEQTAAAATGASCNLAGVFRPLPSADDNRLSRLTRAGHLATSALLVQLPGARWAACGALHLGRDAEHLEQQQKAVEALGLPPELLQFVDAEAAGEKLGWTVTSGGWWFPDGGWVQPSSVCSAALAAFPRSITTRFNTTVDRLESTADGWQALAADGSVLAEAPVMIMASGAAAPRFAQFAWLPQYVARGQVSHLPAEATPATRAVVLGKLGYAIPAVDGIRLIGATSQDGDEDTCERLADHRTNLDNIKRMLPGFASDIDPARLHGRVGLRPMSPDRLPIVGPVPDAAAASRNGRLPALPRLPGLWCVQGFGARGIVWSALMADLLLSRLEGEPLPLESDLVDALDPGRFLLKRTDSGSVDTN